MAKMSPFLVASGLLAFLTISAALDPTLDTAWEDWKSLHGKQYLEGEEAPRRAIWEDNWRMIEQHNLEASQGKHTYRMGMNHFGDLSVEEFEEMMGGGLPDEAKPATGNGSVFRASAARKIPKSVDWRKKGYVTRVKNQKKCGSCWAFSATGALEALHAKKTHKLVSLSEQNLMDCSWDLGNHGCKGGFTKNAFWYVKKNGGLSAERDYKYRAQNGMCRANVKKIPIPIERIVDVKKGSEKALEEAVATFGPVSVSIWPKSSWFQFYASGIISKHCKNRKPHAMLVVGYGENKEGGKYWIIKNSYSEKWGIKGYLYLQKGFNRCGIANRARYPM